MARKLHNIVSISVKSKINLKYYNNKQKLFLTTEYFRYNNKFLSADFETLDLKFWYLCNNKISKVVKNIEKKYYKFRKNDIIKEEFYIILNK